MRTIKAEAKSLLELAVEDAELRQDLRILAQEILAATAASEPGADSAVAALASTSRVEESVVQGPSTSEAAEVDSNRGLERLKELTLGRSPLSQNDARSDPATVKRLEAAHDDLHAIAARCRGKARRLGGPPNACDGSVRGTRSRSKTRRWTRNWSSGPTS